MGLIKTAILTGGGIYAVNRLAKTVEQRSNSPQMNSNSSYYPPQNPYGPPPPPRQSQSPSRSCSPRYQRQGARNTPDDVYADQDAYRSTAAPGYYDQRSGNNNNSNYYLPAPGPSSDEKSAYVSSSDRYHYQPDYPATPPSYSPYPERALPAASAGDAGYVPQQQQQWARSAAGPHRRGGEWRDDVVTVLGDVFGGAAGKR